MKYVLNVTTKCPNYYEEEKDFVYKRIAVIDTGTQKLSQHFMEAFEFIGERGEGGAVLQNVFDVWGDRGGRGRDD